ncbi:hypothetical protein EIN_364250 [Entamoeba invadens IP1]|uniref:Ras family protein n=1 Tax=Entamoeba invadens IP1 TaxID=370355 RepID=A0A0A1U7V5_ENTIV|nr:hypothetical protein EIN_364250 [Entamoeba invadens IP1]ELP90952.1 hypothetical protein EIN_364250 [Entamoeba invadens IP1]|eukprot:XP_004257723.1 hypothetical protein EIN_364250 [Entamoeba invadens IP1]
MTLPIDASETYYNNHPVRMISQSTIRGKSAILIIYSLRDVGTLNEVDNYIKAIEKNVRKTNERLTNDVIDMSDLFYQPILCVVGNQRDEEDKIQVSQREIVKKMTCTQTRFYEMSALKCDGVFYVIDDVTKRSLLKRRYEQSILNEVENTATPHFGKQSHSKENKCVLI